MSGWASDDDNDMGSITVPVVQTVVDETIKEPPPAPIQTHRTDNQFRQDRRVRGRPDRGRPDRRDNRGRAPRDNRERRGYDRPPPQRNGGGFYNVGGKGNDDRRDNRRQYDNRDGRRRNDRRDWKDGPSPREAPPRGHSGGRPRGDSGRSQQHTPRDVSEQDLPTDEPFSVYCGNIPAAVNQEEFVRELFAGLKISDVRTPRNRDFSYIDFETREDLKKALARPPVLNGHHLNIKLDTGRRISQPASEPARERPKLKLLKRTVKKEDEATSVSSRSAIFGAARPRDEKKWAERAEKQKASAAAAAATAATVARPKANAKARTPTGGSPRGRTVAPVSGSSSPRSPKSSWQRAGANNKRRQKQASRGRNPKQQEKSAKADSRVAAAGKQQQQQKQKPKNPSSPRGGYPKQRGGRRLADTRTDGKKPTAMPSEATPGSNKQLSQKGSAQEVKKPPATKAAPTKKVVKKKKVLSTSRFADLMPDSDEDDDDEESED